jgi:hypothetical protein
MEDSYKVRSSHLLQVSEHLCGQMAELQGLRNAVKAAEKSRQTTPTVVEQSRAELLRLNGETPTRYPSQAD